MFLYALLVLLPCVLGFPHKLCIALWVKIREFIQDHFDKVVFPHLVTSEYFKLIRVRCLFPGSAPATDPVSAWEHHVHRETERLWETFDFNNNGKFDRSDVQTFIHDYDTNGDGEVSRAEFDFHWGVEEPTLNIVAHGLFLEYDDDQSGIVTSSDLDALYKRMDHDDDGTVNKHEFKSYYNQLLTVLFILQTQHIENQVTTTVAPST